jgi:hypothetical protein
LDLFVKNGKEVTLELVDAWGLRLGIPPPSHSPPRSQSLSHSHQPRRMHAKYSRHCKAVPFHQQTSQRCKNNLQDSNHNGVSSHRADAKARLLNRPSFKSTTLLNKLNELVKFL